MTERTKAQLYLLQGDVRRLINRAETAESLVASYRPRIAELEVALYALWLHTPEGASKGQVYECYKDIFASKKRPK